MVHYWIRAFIKKQSLCSYYFSNIIVYVLCDIYTLFVYDYRLTETMNNFVLNVYELKYDVEECTYVQYVYYAWVENVPLL